MGSSLSRTWDSGINPSVYGTFRVAVGCVALLKGAILLPAGVSPWVALVWMALAAALTVGYRPRLAAVALLALSGLLLFGGSYKNHLYVFTLVLLLVATSDMARRYSVGRREKGERLSPAWPLLLMRLQLTVVYGYAGIAKVNPEFLSGDVLAHYFEHSLLSIATPSASVLVTLAASVVVLEVFMAFGVWVRRLQPLVFGLAIPLHLGMLLVSGSGVQTVGIIIFALLMFVLLSSFLHLPARGRLVVWDDSCSFCRRWVGLFRRCDAFGALRFVGASDPAAYAGTGITPEAPTTAMQLVEPDGTVRSGFDAVRGIVAVLPGGFMVAPWMVLPGVRHFGARAYRRVAARRTCAYVPAPARYP